MSEDFLRMMQSSADAAGARLGELDELIAELRQSISTDPDTLSRLDLLQAFAVEQVLLNAQQRNSERMLRIIQQVRGSD